MKSREDLVMSNPDLLSDGSRPGSGGVNSMSNVHPDIIDPFGAAPFNPHGENFLFLFKHLFYCKYCHRF